MTEKLGYPSIDDIYLFNTGEAQRADLTFGCRYIPERKEHRFCVWAPNAKSVSVVGDFNEWDSQATLMEQYHGVWVTFVSGLRDGAIYKYAITDRFDNCVLKADPFAYHSEVRPATASKVWDVGGYQA